MSKLYGDRSDDLLNDDTDDLLSRLYKLLPTQTQDMLAMFIFLVILPLGFAFELFYVLSDFYPVFSNPWLLRAGFLSLLSLNVIVNYFMLISVGPNGKNPLLPNVVQAGFRFCHSCRMNAPPRAYHCPVCDKCSFRRDHHCSFAAVCIGHFNQRYFIAGVANLLAICLYFQNCNVSWVAARVPGLTLITAWQFMLPHVALMLRLISLSQFLCLVYFAFSGVVCFFVMYLVAAQVFCVWRGQTRVEYLSDVHAYQLSLLENLRQSMGSRWPLALLFPFIPSPLPSNGMSFTTRDMTPHKSAKSF